MCRRDLWKMRKMGKIKLFQNRSSFVLDFVKIWDKKHIAPLFLIATSFSLVVYSLTFVTGRVLLVGRDSFEK